MDSSRGTRNDSGRSLSSGFEDSLQLVAFATVAVSVVCSPSTLMSDGLTANPVIDGFGNFTVFATAIPGGATETTIVAATPAITALADHIPARDTRAPPSHLAFSA